MTSLSMLPEAARSCFSLWTLILCLIGVFSVILSTVQKRILSAVCSAIPFLCSYFLWQILFDLHLLGGSDAASISRLSGGLPWVYWLLALLALTSVEVLLLTGVIRYGKHSVTPAAVKLCLDQMPCGVCCWRDNGRVLFSNACMNRLCMDITGGALLSGSQFYDAVSDEIKTVGEEVWRFSSRDILLDGERLHEMIASDITAEYAKTQALEQDKEELSRMNRELQDYNRSIDEIVRRQEILQAKVNIHDEMNRLMLSTMAADGDDAATLDRIFSLWEQNALILCMEADEAADSKAAERFRQLADTLGIKLIWRGALPAALSRKQHSLFYSAAQEAIVNAAKHAQAKSMTIAVVEDDDVIRCTFTNDGELPQGEVCFAGGLMNLSILAEKQGAMLAAEAEDAFSLSLVFLKNQPTG